MTQETRTVSVTRRYSVSPERAFDAWLDPAQAGQFLFATETGEMVKAEIDPRVGGSFNFTDRRDGEDVAHTGQYLEIDRPRRLVFTLKVEKYTDLTTTVTIDIRAVDGGCELTLTHQGVWADYAAQTQSGWGLILDAAAPVIER